MCRQVWWSVLVPAQAQGNLVVSVSNNGVDRGETSARFEVISALRSSMTPSSGPASGGTVVNVTVEGGDETLLPYSVDVGGISAALSWSESVLSVYCASACCQGRERHGALAGAV